MSDIFISYASADRSRVTLLVNALTKQGWSVWWDRTILPGKTWDDLIQTALAEARCVVVLWSRESVRSDWVRSEAYEAKRRGILVPVLLDDVDTPLGFRNIQTANLVNWSGSVSEPGIDELVLAISDVVSRAVPPARTSETSSPASTGARSDARGGDATGDRDGEPQSARGKAGAGNAAMSVGPPGKLQTVRIGRSFDTRSLVGVLVVLLFCIGLALYFTAARGTPPHTLATPSGQQVSHADADATGRKPPQPASQGPAGAAGDSKSVPLDDSQANFSGTWIADVNYGGNWSPPNQTYHETFRFTIVGNEVTGSSSLLGLPRAISRGSVNGRKIAFVTEYPLSEGMQHNIYSGTISGDRIEFTYQDTDFDGVIRFSATRGKP